MSNLIGRKLGAYNILEILGKGGMGTVYKGYQPSVGRYVAVKVLPPHPGLDEQYIQRFQLEARTIGNLQHPHILPLYDYGAQDDILYLVMAYADGGTLDDMIDEGAIPLTATERILRQIAAALDYAHRRGVIHRDIKPANILLDSENNVLLADFGVVKMMSDETNLTGTSIVGTPAYMSPEQGQGKPVDGRADIYALGVMVFEMLTGKQPYKADNPMMIILQHINNPVPEMHELNAAVPLSLQPVLDKALAKNPADRYQTATEFAEDFSAALHQSDESLINVRAAFPLAEKTSVIEPGTAPTLQMPNNTANNTVIETTAPQPTIIMQQPAAPRWILGGFAILVLILIGIVLILLTQLSSSTAPTATLVPATAEIVPAVTRIPDNGEVRFSSLNVPGDSLTVRVRDLPPPAENTVYVVWLTNTATQETLALGTMVRDAFGEGTLSYTHPEPIMLPSEYNAVWITQEAQLSETRTGDVIFSGQIPPSVSQALREIFLSSPDGFDGTGSLLAGAQTEAATAEQHSGLAARAANLGGMQTHAEHTVNILTGLEEDLNNNGRGENPGRKIGVYFFLDKMEALVTTAAASSDAHLDVQNNAELIRICTQNVRDWTDRMLALERELLAASDIVSVAEQAEESTQLGSMILQGVDANENGQIEPFEGECGLAQIPEYGIQFGNIAIYEGALNAE